MTPVKDLPTLSSLGERVRWARKRSGMTQKEVADAVHVDQTTISLIERNKPDNPRKLEEIAELLDVPAAWLRFGVEDMPTFQQANVESLVKLETLNESDQTVIRELIERLYNKTK